MCGLGVWKKAVTHSGISKLILAFILLSHKHIPVSIPHPPSLPFSVRFLSFLFEIPFAGKYDTISLRKGISFTAKCIQK